jgi:hypothetical protein
VANHVNYSGVEQRALPVGTPVKGVTHSSSGCGDDRGGGDQRTSVRQLHGRSHSSLSSAAGADGLTGRVLGSWTLPSPALFAQAIRKIEVRSVLLFSFGLYVWFSALPIFSKTKKIPGFLAKDFFALFFR